MEQQITETGTKEELSPNFALKPGKMRVMKRNGKVVAFDREKIKVAIMKAFLAVEGSSAAASTRIHDQVEQLTDDVVSVFERRMPSGGSLHIEDIQDQVELQLMRNEHQQVARSYVLYREERKNQRNEEQLKRETTSQKSEESSNNEASEGFEGKVRKACEGLVDVNPEELIEAIKATAYEGISEEDLSNCILIAARTFVEKEPNYSFVTARLLLDDIENEVLRFLDIDTSIKKDRSKMYQKALVGSIEKGIELEFLDERLKDFDLDRLGKSIKPENDLNFTFLGLQTLYDRYFITHEDTRYEMPQVFLMRVAMGLSVDEKDKNDKAEEFYKLLSSFDYMSSTPTLFNSGTRRPQLSSCYLTTVPDDLSGIYGAIHDNAMLSKWAGGLGNDWTNVRALGSRIKGTNGKSQGIVPFLKVSNDTAVAVNQGGKRKGAFCAYLECWHLDVEEFLELRKNTGDDRRRTHDMNTANWIPDLFMKRLMKNEEWTLFSPSDAPELHDLYGKAFEKKYEEYEKLAASGEIKLFKKIKAEDLWRKILTMLFETGHPWITFKDPCNIRSPQGHVGTVHSSNLCTEITLNTNKDEIAVCNLGSINLPQHIHDGKINVEQLKSSVKTAIRMLDNVIDINYYPVPQAENSNKKHRPIGLGMMGFQDALYKLNIPYNTDEAVNFADESMELISYFAIQASAELAEERGTYESYAGSLWDQGIFPLDSIKILAEERGADFIDQNTDAKLDWKKVRDQVKKHGMRNSNVMAIAPTATIANITGVSPCIEPTYQNLYVKSNLSGEFTVINPYLVEELKKEQLWDDVMIADLKYSQGSLANINRVPENIKNMFQTAFEVEPKFIVESASRRQKWIDQAQSLNLYISNVDGKKLDNTYKMAWYKGLKTTYYLRAIGATSTEMATVDTGSLNAVETNREENMAASQAPKACSILDPDCEACQ
ncbi:ribonucleoside-diphosphate reductase subunit alpha [SAR86 cluster bacterium]|uniref:Vitamin B12-dependent ribonucleotide reductase n=1 Tax=SAR86 cluster bacterium TaxID=2030880 RepID=A0A9Q8X1B3_9GAMM|nr:ribonucleoside-diphosphate reductase subunit alpha [SAR86 cluster bacterium]